VEPSEARKAFHALAYKKYKYLPLYLEWAPDNSFSVPASEIVNDNTAAKESSHSEKVEKETTMKGSKENDANVKTANEEDDDDPPEEDTTLFIKNINFATTEKQLTDVSNWKLLYDGMIGTSLTHHFPVLLPVRMSYETKRDISF